MGYIPLCLYISICISICLTLHLQQYRDIIISSDKSHQQYTMNNQLNFSKKDGQFIQECFKQIIQGYYEQPSPSASQQIILLNTLITESIANVAELDSSQIVPKLQTLKIKAKGNDNLKNSITATVLHLKSPKSLQIKGQTLIRCLKHEGLYSLSCIIIQRLGRTKIKSSITKQSTAEIITTISQGLKTNKTKNIPVMVDALVELLNVYGQFGLDSGIVQIASYIIDNSVKQALKDKSTIQKCLKIIISASKLNPGVIKNKENIFAAILYYQKTSIFQIHDLLSYTYNKQYIVPLLSKISKQTIDFLYLWSYSSIFCLEIEQHHIDQIKDLFSSNQLTNQQQCKLYVIINNFITVSQFDVDFVWKQPKFIKDQKVVNAYLTLIVNFIVHLHGKIGQAFDIVKIEKKCVENKTDTQAIMKLIKNIKDSFNSPNLHGNLGRQSKKAPSQILPSSNNDQSHTLELLLPKASKIPKNDEDLKNIHEVLVYPCENLDESQRENLKTLKNKALDSLKIALMKSQNIYFEKLFNFLDLKLYETEIIKRLLQIANLQLKMNPKAASVINIYHLASIILEIDAKDHDILDFEQLSQIFYMCLGSEKWNIEELSGMNKEEYKVHLLNKIRQLKVHQKKIIRIDSIEDIVDMIDHLKISQQKQEKKQQHQEKKVEPPKTKEDKPIVIEKKEQQQKKEKPKSQIVINIPKEKNKQQKLLPSAKQKKQEHLQQYSSAVLQNRDSHAEKQVIQKMSELNINEVKEKKQQKIEEKSLRQKLTLNIILKYKIKQMVKAWIKRTKKSKQRFFKLRQWSQTQKSYREKLLVIRDQIQNPLIKAGFINDLEASNIFPNLDSMIRLCEQMCVTISQLFKNFNPLTTQLAPSLKSVTNFLKIYKNYSQNYNNSYQHLKILQTDQKFTEYVKVGNLQNYIFSPVQRFQKYHLFVSQYHRCLPKEHKDYGPLQIQLNYLLKVTDEINQFMENELRAKKMVEMEKKFGNVVSNARQFKIQFVANTVDFKCKVYVFNDLLIVAKMTADNREQLYMRIKLCGKSLVVRQPDCLSFKNRLYICGVDTSIHLTFQNLISVQTAYKFISDLLQTMYQNQYKRLDLISQAQSRIRQGASRVSKIQSESTTPQTTSSYNRLQLSVEVSGMEKMYYHGILQTYFIVKFNFSRPYEIYQITFCQLGVLEDLEKHLRLTNPNLKIPTLQIKSKQTIADDLTKVSEHLCIVVEKFLNFVLRNKHLMKKPELTLLRLGLHQSLWIFLNTDRQNTECSCQQCLHAEIFEDMSFYKKQKKMIQSCKYKFCILNSFNTQNTIKSLMSKEIFEDLGVQQRLIWAQCYLRRIDYRLQNYMVLGKRITFKIHVQILSDDIVIEIKSATIYTNSRQIIEEICHRLGIQTTLDLALVFVQDQSQLILDDDQILYNYVKILQEAEEQQRKSQGSSSSGRFSIFDRLTWGSEADLKKVKKMSLCLRKVLCLAHAIQEKQCEKNRERYNLIIGQIIRKIKNQTILVNVEDMQFMCALVYCIENFSRLVVEKRVDIPEQKLKKYLPEAKWSTITNGFVSRVTHLIENQLAISDKVGVLHRSILKYFWQKYYFQYFPVQNTEPSTLLGNFKSLQIGVCYKKVSVSRKQTNASLLQYPVFRFNYRVYADSLYIESQEKTHCFKGNNLFMLDQLIKKYKTMHDFENS